MKDQIIEGTKVIVIPTALAPRDVAPGSGIDLEKLDLFHSHGDAYVTVSVNSHRETWPVASEHFTSIIERYFFELTGSLPENKEIKDMLRRFTGQAKFAGREQKVFTRVGEHDDSIYINLAGPEWKSVKISPTGWEIVSDPTAKFLRPQGMTALPDPVRGGSLDELERFTNLQNEDRILLRAVLVAAFRPRGPYPITLLYGEQGSAKSTLTRVI